MPGQLAKNLLLTGPPGSRIFGSAFLRMIVRESTSRP
jgi:hypothetical protein